MPCFQKLSGSPCPIKRKPQCLSIFTESRIRALSSSLKDKKIPPLKAIYFQQLLVLLHKRNAKRLVNSHRFTRRFHFRTQQQVNIIKPTKWKCHFFYRIIRRNRRIQLKSLNFRPTINLAAIFAILFPVDFATKGTVRDARGLTSITNSSSP